MGVRIPFIEIMWKIERLVGYPEYVYVDNIKGGNEKVMEIVDRNFKKEKKLKSLHLNTANFYILISSPCLYDLIIHTSASYLLLNDML